MLTLASARSERGELTLLRRPDGALELRVNGAFAMDSAETASERLLAAAALDAVGSKRSAPPVELDVLVGGLGLGFTLAALVDDDRVGAVLVAEIEPELVRWHRSGVVPKPDAHGRPARSIVDEPKVTVELGDVRHCVARQPPASIDLILLDVDNGPDFLLYDANADLYEAPFMRTCARALRRGGVTAVWSSSESAELASAMSATFASMHRRDVDVVLNQRKTAYHLYIGAVGST